MILSLGPAGIGINFREVAINDQPEKTILNVQLEVLVTEENKEILGFSSATRNTYELFVVGVREPGYANRILRSNNDIIKCLESPENPVHGVAVMYRDLVSQGEQNIQYHSSINNVLSFGRNITLEYKNTTAATDLVMFAGIVTKSEYSDISLICMQNLTVLSEGERLKNNTVLYEDSGKTKVYMGPATRGTRGKWYIPSTGAPSKRLYEEVVPNDLVIVENDDKEFIPRIQEAPKDPYNLEKRHPTEDEVIIHEKKRTPCSYFSPLNVAHTEDGTVALSFSFNRYDFFKNQSGFGHLIKNTEELLSSFGLVTVRVLRRRKTSPGGTNELTLSHVPPLDYDSEEVLVTTDVTFPAFTRDPGILTIATTDPGLQRVGEGIYQYCVELEFMDRTQEKIEDILTNPRTGLQQTLTQLGHLSVSANSSAARNNQEGQLSAAYLQSYLRLPADQQADHVARERFLSAMAVFDSKYTEQEYYERLKHNTSLASRGTTGVSVLEGMIGDLDSQLQRELRSVSSVGSRQSTGCRKGEGAVAKSDVEGSGDPGKRILRIKCCFEELVDAAEARRYGFGYLDIPGGYPADPVFTPFKTLTYEMMGALVTTEEEKITEDIQRQGNNSPLTITPNFFNTGDMKYVINSTDPVKDETRGVGQRLVAANMYKNSPLDFKQFDFTYNPTSFPLGHVTQIRTALSMMAFNGCSVEVVPDTSITAAGSVSSDFTGDLLFGDITVVGATQGNNLLDAAVKVSEPSPFVINKKGHDSLKDFTAASNNNSQDYNYLREIVKIDLCILYHLIQTDYFVGHQDNLSSGVKSITSGDVFRSSDQTREKVLALGAESEAVSTSNRGAQMIAQTMGLGGTGAPVSMQQLSYAHKLNPNDGGPQAVRGCQINEFALRYGLERKVQYFQGFRGTATAGVQTYGPIWIDLTKQLLDNFSRSGEALLCRLVENQTKAGFSEFDGIDAPVYDEIFVVNGHGDSPGGVSSRPQTSSPEITQRSYNGHSRETKISSVYSFSATPGVLVNSRLQPSLIESNSAANKEKPNAVGHHTAGGDFVYPSGKMYVGPYHLHITENGLAVAMEGAFHTNKSHSKLKAVSGRAISLVAQYQQNGSSPSARTSAANSSNGRGSY